MDFPDGQWLRSCAPNTGGTEFDPWSRTRCHMHPGRANKSKKKEPEMCMLKQSSFSTVRLCEGGLGKRRKLNITLLSTCVASF